MRGAVKRKKDATIVASFEISENDEQAYRAAVYSSATLSQLITLKKAAM